MRLPKQVLIIPYRIDAENIKYAVFKRSDSKYFQFISGGVEDFDKDIFEGAKREFFEETGINGIELEQLEIITKIPVVNIVKDFVWGKDVFYAEEYTFAANINDRVINLSKEHDEYKWVEFKEAKELLKYDSNKSALWELNEKLKRKHNL